MVFVGTEELENRLRRDLLVDEDGGEVDVHAWAMTKEMIICPLSSTWGRPPCAGHAMIAALELDDAVLSAVPDTHLRAYESVLDPLCTLML